MGSVEAMTATDVRNATLEAVAENGHVESALLKHYVVSDEHIHKKRQVRIICIGAGIAGIAAAYKFQRRLSDASLVIYEKNHDVGGTWLENRYPGCACQCSYTRHRTSFR